MTETKVPYVYGTCEVCGGDASLTRDPVTAERYVDYGAGAWLHASPEDWQDNPHQVVPILVWSREPEAAREALDRQGIGYGAGVLPPPVRQ